MSAWTWVAFALGAGIGAPLRFAIDDAVDQGTLIVNALGSFVLGVVTALTLGGHVSDDVVAIVGAGFCGSLTTFSTFAVQTVRLLESGAVDEALRNVALNTSVAIAVTALGYAIVLGFV